MSKHSDSEAKLHLPLSMRGNNQPRKQAPALKISRAPQVPPKGTNANNQYH